jgi:opacity protein-like surface antigen
MHRFLGRFVIGAGALLIAATASAQGTSGSSSTRPIKFGGVLGATIPLGDFSDAANLGFHLGALVEDKLTSLPVTLRGEITYHRNGLDDGFFSGIPDASGGNVSMLNFLANVVIPFGDTKSTAQPYAIGGLGVYHIKYSGDAPGGVDLSTSATKFGINVGGGVTFNLSGFETFIEARFHSAFTEGSNTTFIPISFGFKF